MENEQVRRIVEVTSAYIEGVESLKEVVGQAIDLISSDSPQASALDDLAGISGASRYPKSDVLPMIEGLYDTLRITRKDRDTRQTRAALWIARKLLKGDIDVIDACNDITLLANSNSRIFKELSPFVSLMSDFAEFGFTQELIGDAHTAARQLIDAHAEEA